MHIFIDESGTFVIPPNKEWSPCLVGALIVPDHKLDKLYSKYARIRLNLPKEKGEVKGKLLSEDEVAKVVDILRRNSCIFKAHVIEMALESTTEIKDHQEASARGITNNLTDQHHREFVEQCWWLRGGLEEMTPQLYVQYEIMFGLLADLLREAPLYWAQREMKELLRFHWVVDGKGEIELTKWERWWSTIKTAIIQSKLAREPIGFLEGLDYTEFDARYRTPMPTYSKESNLPYEKGYNLNLLMDESFRFSSGNDYGLELVDVLTNATRRALKGNLGRNGWGNIPKLMIHRGESYLRFKSFGKSQRVEAVPYKRLVTDDFATGGRPMLTE